MTTLSVVVGCIDCAATIETSIAALRSACEGIEHELIFVDASIDDTPERIARIAPESVLLRKPVGALVPVLWSTGIAAARGDTVALTTGNFSVAATWARALVTGVESGAAGAGGPLVLADHASIADAAVFFQRYSAFLPRNEEMSEVRDIAGDNAAYSITALRNVDWSVERGFWETEVNRALVNSGARLVMINAARSTFLGGVPLRSFARQRFIHGKLFGDWRVRTGGEGAIRIVARSPFVPFMMVLRIFRRARLYGRQRTVPLRALPVLAWLSACWAAGEARGAAGTFGNK